MTDMGGMGYMDLKLKIWVKWWLWMEAINLADRALIEELEILREIHAIPKMNKSVFVGPKPVILKFSLNLLSTFSELHMATGI